jgi:crotonobetainyl-CoA:carnitine CoA-transferase CaiB-like acyl-CoA transferase
VWNRSRRSLAIDLKSDEGREVFRKLVADADVVAESFRPGVMDGLGFGYDELAKINPRVILLSVPGYPAGHRYAGRPGYDALVAASSGQQWEQTGWRFGPIFLHMPMPSMGAFFLVSIGVAGALFARENTGRGQHVETSLFQGAMLYTTQIWQSVEKAPAAFHELMAKSYPPGIHQQMIFECANNEWIHVSVMSGLTAIKSQDEILGVEGSGDIFTFLTLPPEEREKINVARRAAYLKHDRDALAAELQANGHAAEPIIPASEMFGHAQLQANDMVATVVDPDLGPTTQVGVPVHFLSTPGAIRGPQPRVGEHNREILAELGYGDSDIDALLAKGVL